MSAETSLDSRVAVVQLTMTLSSKNKVIILDKVMSKSTEIINSTFLTQIKE